MFKSWTNIDVSSNKKIIFWREMLCDAFTDLRPEITTISQDFECEIRSQDLSDGLVISFLSSQKQIIYRTDTEIQNSKDDFLFFNLQKNGSACIKQNNTTAFIQAGDLYILDTRYPYEIEQFDNQWQSLSLRAPLDNLANCKLPLSKIIDTSNSNDNFVLYESILTLEKIIGKNTSEKTNEIISKTTIELIKSNFKNNDDKKNIQLQKILRYIENNATNHSLRCSEIAKIFNTSERNIYKIFENENLSLNHIISEARLNNFIDLMKDHQGNITEFAYKSGFNDLSNFYKFFKKKFNETPKNYFKKNI